jgi:hypothetical protein
MSPERQLHAGEQQEKLSLFLSYQDGHRLILNDMIENFSNELKKIGAVLRTTDIYDFQSRNSRQDKYKALDCWVSF